MLRASLFVLIAVFLCTASNWGQDPKKDDGDKEEMKRFEGVWLWDRSEHEGVTIRSTQGLGYAFKGDAVNSFNILRQEEVKGTYKIDRSKNPKTIDITLKEKDKKEVHLLGIYKFEKEELTISWSQPGDKERPQGFDQNKARVSYYVRPK